MSKTVICVECGAPEKAEEAYYGDEGPLCVICGRTARFGAERLPEARCKGFDWAVPCQERATKVIIDLGTRVKHYRCQRHAERILRQSSRFREVTENDSRNDS